MIGPMMVKPIENGSLLNSKRYGVCTVVNHKRTGHQYDRHWEYEVMTPAGSIVSIDEYDLWRDTKIVATGEEDV